MPEAPDPDVPAPEAVAPETPGPEAADPGTPAPEPSEPELPGPGNPEADPGNPAVPDPEVRNVIRVDYDITVPAYVSDALRVALVRGEDELDAAWIGDELWSATEVLPTNTETSPTVTFRDDDGGLTLGTAELSFRTGTNAMQIVRVTAEQFDTVGWDDDGDGASNLDESIAGTDPRTGDSGGLERRETFNPFNAAVRPTALEALERASAFHESSMPEAFPYVESVREDPPEETHGYPTPGYVFLLEADLDASGNGDFARAGRRWPAGRTAAFAGGVALLAVAAAPPLAAWAHGDLRGHMVQHVLVGMLAPLGLVLGAPVTLVLRTAPVPAARRISRALRSGLVRVVSHPAAAALLNVGGMTALYLTPLYAAMQGSAVLHAAVHGHVVLAGALFAWSVLGGPDPAPHPAPLRTRVVVLTLSIAAHAVLGKVMYGFLWPRGVAGAAEVEAAAQVMYYGGDLAEALLVVAVFARWYRAGRPLGAGRAPGGVAARGVGLAPRA